jgi:RNA polymerase sigma-70 factor (ECF subfamily)
MQVPVVGAACVVGVHDAAPVTSPAPVRLAGEHEIALLEWLLMATANGDHGAFRRLHAIAAPRLLAMALRMVRSRAEAEEILQEALLAIWSNAGAYTQARSGPMTWMTAIVRNRCIDALRRPRLELVPGSAALEGDPLDSHAGPADDPFDSLVRARGEERVRGALAALPANARQALVLAFAHGMSHAEVAAHLGIPRGIAKSWIRRGFEAMRRDAPLD